VATQSRTFLAVEIKASLLRVELGRLAGDEKGTLLKLSPTQQANTAIFLRVDAKSSVSQITSGEYETVVGKTADSPGRNEIPGAATPAPLEPK